MNEIPNPSMSDAAINTGDFRNSFSRFADLPPSIAALGPISMNFYWTWRPEGEDLFRDIDPSLWDECEQNPRLLLLRADELRLWQRAVDTEFVARVEAFSKEMDEYLSAPADSFSANGREISAARPIAYFCAEYGIHNSLPNYSGGLGILAGDHLKSASDLNIPLVAVGLLYRFGYFRQRIAHDGWQEESYSDIFASELALSRVLDNEGRPVKVMVHIRGREVYAAAWLAKVGRISLYLLDTNLPENAAIDRLITGHLYGGDSQTRIVQEKVLGIGGIRLLKKLGFDPSVYHLNEGHSAFLTLELAHDYLQSNPLASFEEARLAIREKCVFTTHTPVAAGNDVFSPDELRYCFDKRFIDGLKLTEEQFLGLGRVRPQDSTETFGMTPFALRMSRSVNGVSRKHAEVSRNLWREMFPEAASPENVPIIYVTNGVHPSTWISPVIQDLYRRMIGPDWPKLIRVPEKWSKAIKSISDEEIWKAHMALKNLLVAFVRQKTLRTETGLYETINERENTSSLFSPDVLTIGFARRVAAYKRWDLLFTDLERLLQLVDNPERPVQFVFAGKAHPQDKTAKQILRDLMSINHNSDWQRRAVFIEDYDHRIARYLVQGVDVWLNVPRRPLEASGTSGMKAAMNGVLNFSILDGWWPEGFNQQNGFAIGGLTTGDNEEVDREDAEALYDTLETQVIPRFYDRKASGMPSAWIEMMKNSIASLTPKFSSDRMLREYIEKIYLA
ncbi:MAG: alpha-glucan phosphorylase [Blastocatellia bacterium]